MSFGRKSSSLIFILSSFLSYKAQAGKPIELFNYKVEEDTSLEYKIFKFDLFTNYKQILADKKYEQPTQRTPVSGLLRHEYNGQTVDAQIIVRSRGWDRLNVCNIPPLKLDFDAKKFDYSQTAFNDSKDLKLVTSCYNGVGKYGKRRWVIREYILYRMYERVTPFALKVRPVHVGHRHADGQYVWTGKNHKGEIATNKEDFGFLIENTSQMAKRLGFKKYDLPKPPQGMDFRLVDQDLYKKIHLFNYMIYNDDFGLLSNDVKNLDAVIDPQTNKIYPITYDFDWSEFVRKPNYAPSDTIIENPNFCYTWEDMLPTINHFKTLKNVFIQDIKRYSNAKFLNDYETKYYINAINVFYNKLDNGEFKSVIQRTLRKNRRECR